MSELIDNGNINAAKNVHEKAAETISEFEEVSFNTQDNNETTLAANSTADNSTSNININTRATGQQQTPNNGTLHNEQPETSNSA